MTPTYEDEVYEDGQQFKDDKRLVVMFWVNAIKNEFETAQQGRPIFNDVEYITIITPGQRDNMVTEVTDVYRNRFRRQYENFKARKDQDVTGTPLSELPWMSASQVAEFNALHVKTVEQLVSLPDAVAMKFMGFHDFKRRAERFLDAAKDAAPDMKLELALKERDEQIAFLSEQVKNLVAKSDAKESADKPKMTKV